MSPYSIPCGGSQHAVGDVSERANALTVVDHLHVVTGTGLTDPVTAGLAIDLSSSRLEDLLDVRPSRGGTTGHE